jgi:cytosine/uracil/thiamine/allantoin permease
MAMLTEVQYFVIALVASVIVYVLKMAKITEKPGWLTVLVYGVSFGLAILFARPSLPPLPICSEPTICSELYLNYAYAWLAIISSLVGFATLLYNALLKNVLDKWAAPLFKKPAA